MAILLNTPIYIEQPGKCIYPAPGVISNDDRLFIVSSSNSLAEAIISGINEHMASSRSLSVAALNTIADELLTAGNEYSAESLAMAYINRKGCTVMQIGKSRVMHISKLSGEIEYDSSNHIPDTLSSKAKTELITKIYTGDVVLLTLSDRVDSQRLLQLLSDESIDEMAMPARLKALLGKHRDCAPASFALKFSGSAGFGVNFKNFISDINWKWILTFIALAAVICAVAFMSFNSNLSSIIGATPDDKPAVSHDTLDTLKQPEPAIQDIQDLADETPTAKGTGDSLKVAKKKEVVRDDQPKTVREEASSPKAAEPQHTTTTPAVAPAPAQTPEPAPEPQTPQAQQSPENPQ